MGCEDGDSEVASSWGLGWLVQKMEPTARNKKKELTAEALSKSALLQQMLIELH